MGRTAWPGRVDADASSPCSHLPGAASRVKNLPASTIFSLSTDARLTMLRPEIQQTASLGRRTFFEKYFPVLTLPMLVIVQQLLEP